MRIKEDGAVSSASASQNSALGRVFGSKNSMRWSSVSSRSAEPPRFCAEVGTVSTLMIGSLGASSLGLMAGALSGYCVIRSCGAPFSASRIATTRVACVTLPPPTLMSRSALAARAAAVAASTEGSVESFSISSNTPAQPSPSMRRMRAMRSVRRETVRPHRIKARCALLRFNSAGRFSSASLPL